MKRIFSIALISLSVSILLLHSFVPHHHSPGSFNLREILKNEPVKSPIDLLKVGFHLNLGANHLENFQKNKSIITEKKTVDKEKIKIIDFVLSGVHYSYYSLQKNTKAFPAGTYLTFRSEFITSFNYRGPPIFA